MGKRAAAIVWKPDSDQANTTVNNAPAKKLAGSCEISSLALKSGAQAAYAAIYDGTGSSDVIPANLRWVLDAAAPGNDNQDFDAAIVFKRGVFAVLEVGSGANAALCIAAVLYTNP